MCWGPQSTPACPGAQEVASHRVEGLDVPSGTGFWADRRPGAGSGQAVVRAGVGLDSVWTKTAEAPGPGWAGGAAGPPPSLWAMRLPGGNVNHEALEGAAGVRVVFLLVLTCTLSVPLFLLCIFSTFLIYKFFGAI
ncbi:hypothetical protein H1C71_035019 [Ictidomys tridecemlineatus]|nr:hypothetical protein H1C71_035019 [Ictidomys tridecemlineatus]